MNEEKLKFDRLYETPAIQNFVAREVLLACAPLTPFRWSKLPAPASELLQSFLSRHCPERYTHKHRHMEQDLYRIWTEAEAYGRAQVMQHQPEKPRIGWWRRLWKR